ncbi:MAG: transketolase [Lentisphaerae bacterium RIFOXYA12_FULL_48_11]|nr:MAG: transketolase [Lentisphaerae bacterium RIFOXYA12_FULL_48_11]
MDLLIKMKEKAEWVWKETLFLHGLAPETRLASSLSDVEILTVLFYSGLMHYNPKLPFSDKRDRLIISKGHGSISMYPILADVGFFGLDELAKISQSDSLLGVIPDTLIPGYETINGSLGHGLGVACGMALALKRKGIDRRVFVLCGDGELNSGAMWEAIMLASFHCLDNLFVIVDNNKMSMLGYQKDILGLEPLEEKFSAFKWNSDVINGHNIEKIYETLNGLLNQRNGRPSVIIADTIKARGILQWENDELCHIRSLKAEEVKRLLKEKK